MSLQSTSEAKPIAEPEFGTRQKPDCVLVDDDVLIHMTWRVSAAECSKQVLLFSNIQELFQVLPTLDPSTPIYLDANLGNGVRGEDLALALKAQGFDNLFLSTGYSGESLGRIPDGVRVVGKTPPWEFSVNEMPATD